MLLTPYVRFAMHHIWLENYYADRVLWDHEIIFIEHGSLKFRIADKDYIAVENDCILLRPNVPHIIEWNGNNCSQPHVHFDFYTQEDSDKVGISFKARSEMSKKEKMLFREDFYSKNNIEIPDIIHLKNPIKVKNLLYEIINEFTYKKPNYEIFLQGLMIELIGTILRENEIINNNSSKVQNLNDIIVFMNENVDQNLTLDDFANYLKVSKWTVIKLFKNNFHCSPMKYYNNLKVIRAKNLLDFSFLSVSDISEKMNFEEPQTFSRWFKQNSGFYPSTYRKNKQM